MNIPSFNTRAVSTHLSLGSIWITYLVTNRMLECVHRLKLQQDSPDFSYTQSKLVENRVQMQFILSREAGEFFVTIFPNELEIVGERQRIRLA